MLFCFFLEGGKSTAETDVGRLILQNAIERTAKQRKQQNQKYEGEFERAFSVSSCEKMETDEDADCGHNVSQPLKLLVVNDGGKNESKLKQD